MADQSGPFAGLTTQDQKLMLCALKSLKNGLDVDYPKLAENMEWFMKDDETKPNAKKANNAWLATRKKIFPDGAPGPITPTAGSAANKGTSTPRRKEAETQKASRAKKTPAKSQPEKAKDEPEEDGVVSGDTAVKQTDRDAKENENENKGEVVNTENNIADADGENAMSGPGPTEISHDPKVAPVAGTSVADDISAGSMSPTAASSHTTQVPKTPQGKAAPKVPKSTQSGSIVSASDIVSPGTPTPAPKATPKKRKTKAEQEAEGTKTAGVKAAGDDAEAEPAAKKQKFGATTTKTGAAIPGGDDKEGDGEDQATQSTPVKTPRKPSAAAVAKKEAREKEKASKKAEKEREKADKKAAKDKEKAEKQAAKTPAKKKSGGGLASQTPQKSADAAPSAAANASAVASPSAANPSATNSELVEKGAGNEDNVEVITKTVDAPAQAQAQAQAALALLTSHETATNKESNDVRNVASVDAPAETTSTHTIGSTSKPVQAQVQIDRHQEDSAVTGAGTKEVTETAVNDPESRVKTNSTPEAVITASETVEKVVENAGGETVNVVQG